jgi:hypothetical protein
VWSLASQIASFDPSQIAGSIRPRLGWGPEMGCRSVPFGRVIKVWGVRAGAGWGWGPAWPGLGPSWNAGILRGNSRHFCRFQCLCVFGMFGNNVCVQTLCTKVFRKVARGEIRGFESVRKVFVKFL